MTATNAPNGPYEDFETDIEFVWDESFSDSTNKTTQGHSTLYILL